MSPNGLDGGPYQEQPPSPPPSQARHENKNDKVCLLDYQFRFAILLLVFNVGVLALRGRLQWYGSTVISSLLTFVLIAAGFHIIHLRGAALSRQIVALAFVLETVSAIIVELIENLPVDVVRKVFPGALNAGFRPVAISTLVVIAILAVFATRRSLGSGGQAGK